MWPSASVTVRIVPCLVEHTLITASKCCCCINTIIAAVAHATSYFMLLIPFLLVAVCHYHSHRYRQNLSFLNAGRWQYKSFPRHCNVLFKTSRQIQSSVDAFRLLSGHRHPLLLVISAKPLGVWHVTKNQAGNILVEPETPGIKDNVTFRPG